MQISLFDSMASLPKDEGSHILVFAGHRSLVQDDVADIVTEIHCTCRIGDSTIKFLRNGDGAELRFEQAFSWAIDYAAKHQIDDVFGVFELDRPIDHRYLNALCPNGIIDRRERPDSAKTARAASAATVISSHWTVLGKNLRAASACAMSALPVLPAANANSRRLGDRVLS